MGRGIGTLTVSVQANTANAVKNLRSFANEARATGKSAREMSASFRGNSIADYKDRFGPKPEAVRAATEGMNSFRSSVVDLRNQTDRYNGIGEKQVNIFKGLDRASKSLKEVGKAGLVAVAAIEGFKFGQQIRGHIEYIHSWSDAWRELKSTVGLAQSGYDLEMEKMDRKAQREAAATAKLDEELAYARDLARREDVFQRGEKAVNRDEMEQRYAGRDYIAREEALAAKIAAREAAAEARRKKDHDEKMAREAAADKRKHDAEKREQEHQQRIKREAEIVRNLRDRIADSGKTSLQAERDQLLRTIQDTKQQAEVRRSFRELEDIEAHKDQIGRLKSQRDMLANRGGNGPILDARTAEGWAALRSSVRSPELAKLDEQIALMKEANRIAAEKQNEEVFSL